MKQHTAALALAAACCAAPASAETVKIAFIDALTGAFAPPGQTALKNFQVAERITLQFRAESFNLANHANFGLPIADMASPSFGRILLAGPPRLTQFALKAIF